MYLAAKIFASFFALIVIARSIMDYKAKKESLQMTVFWVIVWAGILSVAFFPQLIEQALAFTGEKRAGLGSIFGMAIVFLLFVTYRVYIKANRIEKQVNHLIRSFILKHLDEEKATKRRKRK